MSFECILAFMGSHLLLVVVAFRALAVPGRSERGTTLDASAALANYEGLLSHPKFKPKTIKNAPSSRDVCWLSDIFSVLW